MNEWQLVYGRGHNQQSSPRRERTAQHFTAHRDRISEEQNPLSVQSGRHEHRHDPRRGCLGFLPQAPTEISIRVPDRWLSSTFAPGAQTAENNCDEGYNSNDDDEQRSNAENDEVYATNEVSLCSDNADESFEQRHISTEDVTFIEDRTGLSKQNTYYNRQGFTRSEISGNDVTFSAVAAGYYMRKIFVCGLPERSTADDVRAIFNRFGRIWTVFPLTYRAGGYAWVTFEDDESPLRLIESCAQKEENADSYFLQMEDSNRTLEVRLWAVDDDDFIADDRSSSSENRSVVATMLGGTYGARGLAALMSSHFGDVVRVKLSIHHSSGYPDGRALVTFKSVEGFINAVNARALVLRRSHFTMSIKIRPDLLHTSCCMCSAEATLFCRGENCYEYFCEEHWRNSHAQNWTQHKRTRIAKDKPHGNFRL